MRFNECINIQFSLQFLTKRLIDDKLALLQEIASRKISLWILPEPMKTILCDAVWRH